MLILQLTFHRRLKDALKLSQIKIEFERFEIRIQFRNRWVFKKLIPKMIFIVVLRARFLGIFRLKVIGKSLYKSIAFFEKQFCIIFVFWFAPNDSLFVRSFILALRLGNLSSSKVGRSAFRSLIKYIITRYFMRCSFGTILCLILRSVVLSNLVLLKHASNPQFSCLFRVTQSDFLRPENRTIG